MVKVDLAGLYCPGTGQDDGNTGERDRQVEVGVLEQVNDLVPGGYQKYQLFLSLPM